MFCAELRPTSKRDREQKPITKKLDESHSNFIVLTMIEVKQVQFFLTLSVLINSGTGIIFSIFIVFTCIRSKHMCYQHAQKAMHEF